MTVLWRFYFIPVWFCSSLFISFLFHFLITCICSDWEPKLENVPSVYHQWPLVAHGAQKKQTRTWRRFTGFTGRQWCLQTRWCGWRRRPHSATLCSRANMGWRRASLHKMLFLSEISHSPCPPPAPMSYSLHPVTPAALAQHQHLIHTTPHHTTPLRHLLSNTLVNTQLCDSVRIT